MSGSGVGRGAGGMGRGLGAGAHSADIRSHTREEPRAMSRFVQSAVKKMTRA